MSGEAFVDLQGSSVRVMGSDVETVAIMAAIIWISAEETDADECVKVAAELYGKAAKLMRSK